MSRSVDTFECAVIKKIMAPYFIRLHIHWVLQLYQNSRWDMPSNFFAHLKRPGILFAFFILIIWESKGKCLGKGWAVEAARALSVTMISNDNWHGDPIQKPLKTLPALQKVYLHAAKDLWRDILSAFVNFYAKDLAFFLFRGPVWTSMLFKFMLSSFTLASRPSAKWRDP